MIMLPPAVQALASRTRASPPRALALALAAFATVAVPGGAAAAVLSEDPGDQTYLTIAINEALETRKTETEIALRNPDTGSQGTMVIERTYYRDPTTPCRDYRRSIQRAGGPASEVRGTGCRIGKALWSLDEVMTRTPRGTQPPDKSDRPLPLSPSTSAPAAKPPASSRAPSRNGGTAAPPPGPAKPAPPPPIPSYTLPSRAAL